jgi:hypothetical protein
MIQEQCDKGTAQRSLCTPLPTTLLHNTFSTHNLEIEYYKLHGTRGLAV